MEPASAREKAGPVNDRPHRWRRLAVP